MDKVKATIGIQLDYPGEEMSISKEFVVAGDTATWDELCEQFFMLLGGLGYQLPGSPQELTTILNMEHQKQMKEIDHEECINQIDNIHMTMEARDEG